MVLPLRHRRQRTIQPHLWIHRLPRCPFPRLSNELERLLNLPPIPSLTLGPPHPKLILHPLQLPRNTHPMPPTLSPPPSPISHIPPPQLASRRTAFFPVYTKPTSTLNLPAMSKTTRRISHTFSMLSSWRYYPKLPAGQMPNGPWALCAKNTVQCSPTTTLYPKAKISWQKRSDAGGCIIVNP